MSTTADQPRQTDGRFAGFAAPRADVDLASAAARRVAPLGDATTRSAPARLDPAADLGDDLPWPDEDLTVEPEPLHAADARAVTLLHRTAGPGQHLDQLTDSEHAALIAHCGRIDAAIARHHDGEPDDTDWPFDIDTMAEDTGAILHRGTTPDLGDDPTDYDWNQLSDHAADTLRDVRTAWLERAEAYSLQRPIGGPVCA